MSAACYTKLVSEAKTPQEAMVWLAQGIDQVITWMDEERERPRDAWGPIDASWSGADVAAIDARRDTSDTPPRELKAEAYRKAMREVVDSSQEPGDWAKPDVQAATFAELEAREHAERRTAINLDGTGNADVNTGKPTEAQRAARETFERDHLKLHEYLGDTEDWHHAYVEGGPQWLYLGNRELVMSMPEQFKRALVADLEQSSPTEAHEMARDILKEACADGPSGSGMFIADGLNPDGVARGTL